MVTGNPTVMFTDFAVMLLPQIELEAADAELQDQGVEGDFRLFSPLHEEINDLVANFVGATNAPSDLNKFFFKGVSELCQ